MFSKRQFVIKKKYIFDTKTCSTLMLRQNRFLNLTHTLRPKHPQTHILHKHVQIRWIKLIIEFIGHCNGRCHSSYRGKIFFCFSRHSICILHRRGCIQYRLYFITYSQINDLKNGGNIGKRKSIRLGVGMFEFSAVFERNYLFSGIFKNKVNTQSEPLIIDAAFRFTLWPLEERLEFFGLRCSHKLWFFFYFRKNYYFEDRAELINNFHCNCRGYEISKKYSKSEDVSTPLDEAIAVLKETTLKDGEYIEATETLENLLNKNEKM